MSWDLGEGTFKINSIKSAFLKKSQSGNGMVILGLSVENKTIYWNGVLTEKMAPICIAALARLGYSEPNLLAIADREKSISELFPDFPEGRAEVVIVNEPYTVTDEETGEEYEKDSFKAKWINVEGYHSGDAGMSHEEAIKEASIFSFEGDLAKFQQEVKTANLKKKLDKPEPAAMMQKPQEEQKDPETGTALDDLPF